MTAPAKVDVAMEAAKAGREERKVRRLLGLLVAGRLGELEPDASGRVGLGDVERAADGLAEDLMDVLQGTVGATANAFIHEVTRGEVSSPERPAFAKFMRRTRALGGRNLRGGVVAAWELSQDAWADGGRWALRVDVANAVMSKVCIDY